MDPQQGHHYFTRSKGRYTPVAYRPPVIVKQCEVNLQDEQDRFWGPRVVACYIDSVIYGKIKIE